MNSKILFFLTIVPFVSFAQTDSVYKPKPPVFGQHNVTAFDTSPDSTVYSALQQFWNAGLPLSYLTFPMAGIRERSIERVGPLVLGEGMNGYILEGNMDLNFVLNQGRRHHPHWQQTFRLSFKYAPGVRMTRDNSSNLLPTNQKVGLQIDKVLWDSYSRIFFTESNGRTELAERKNFFNDTRKDLHSLNFTLIAMHYSNGQPEGVFRSIDSARNDYIKGDFSTNLIQPSLTYNYYNRKRQLFSANLGYQYDATWFGPFYYIDEQIGRYGRHRTLGYFQFRSGPKKNPFFAHTKKVRGRDGKDYKIHRLWEYRLRWEWEYILDDLSTFKRSKDYRFNWHLYLEGQPMRSRTLGYFVHLYRGRDYFNIRYDDIVQFFQFGFTFTINRYLNPRFHPDEAIKEYSAEMPGFFQKQQEKRRRK